MEENKDIDKIFRDHLDPFEMEPSEQVWTSIQAQLDKKKKNRGLWFFWLALVTGVVSFGIYQFMDTKQASVSVNENQKTEAAIENLQEEKIASGNYSATSDEQQRAAVNKIVNDPSASSQKENSISTEGSIQDQSSWTAANDPGLKNGKPSGNTQAESNGNALRQFAPASENPAPAGTGNTVLTEANNFSSPRKMQESTNDEQQGTSSAPQPEQQPASENSNRESSIEEPVSKESNTGTTPEKAHASENTADDRTPATSDEVPATSKEAVAAEPSPVHPAETVASNSSASDIAEVPVANAKGLKTMLKKVGSHISFGAYYSPDYAVNRTTGTSSAESRSSGYSWTGGVRVGYDLSKRFSISSGASYSSYSNSESFSSIYVTSDSAYKERHEDDHEHGFEHEHHHEGGGGWGGGGHGQGGGQGGDGGGPGQGGCHYVLHTSCGDLDLSDLPPGATGNEESGDTMKVSTEVTSSVEFINVPLKVRYNFRMRKLVYFIEAGASMSFIRNSAAQISIGSYSENNAVSGLTNFNYSALLNLGVEYRFYRGIGIFLEPHVRYSLTPINDSGAEKSYPYFIGGNVGLSIHF